MANTKTNIMLNSIKSIDKFAVCRFKLDPWSFSTEKEPVKHFYWLLRIYFGLNKAKSANYKKELNFLKQNYKNVTGISYVFPYSFVLHYSPSNVEVLWDQNKGLFYVMHKAQKLFYSRKYSLKEKVQISYYALEVEQDKESPHCYFNNNVVYPQKGVILDIGAVEGNFSFDVVEQANFLYIFVPDQDWIEALNYTFEPWKEKVKIINSLVGSKDTLETICLDSLLPEGEVDFIKMDVEVMELEILNGGQELIQRSSKIKIIATTYHNENDGNMIQTFFEKLSFKYNYSPRYMLFIHKLISKPYFRKGLLFTYKNQN